MRQIGPLLLLLLAGCDQQPAAKGTANDCLDLPVYPPAGVSDLGQEVFACVERNAAMFAKGPDSMEALSKAVIATCEQKVIRFVAQEAKAAGEQPKYNEALEAWRKH